MTTTLLIVFLIVLNCKNNFAQFIDHPSKDPNKQRQDLRINPQEQIKGEEDNTAYKLKLGDSEIPINTHNSQKPNERQIETIKNTFVDDFLVNDDAGSADQFGSSISMDVAGNFVIAWYDFRNANWDIYFQRYNSNGTALGVNTKVNDDAGSAYQKVPSISMDGVGNFVIVWQDYRYGQTNPDIIGQRYFSSGYPNGANYRIVADGPNNGETSPVLCADNSSIIFSWADNRRSKGWDIYAKIVSWNWNGVTGVIDEGNNNPKDFSLSQSYPNPFNPTTTINWQSPVGSWQTLKVYDVLGREIATLVNERLPAGKHEIVWDAGGFPSGLYFYKLKSGEFVETKKMILMR